jgi:hypothetical protein
MHPSVFQLNSTADLGFTIPCLWKSCFVHASLIPLLPWLHLLFLLLTSFSLPCKHGWLTFELFSQSAHLLLPLLSCPLLRWRRNARFYSAP